MSVLKFNRPEFPIPAEMSLLIGEILYNLRGCLDYLVYQLAILDSGSEQNGTQFPIEDSQNGFRGRRKSYLKFVNDSHVASIERLQPYNGVDWTKWLRTYSNPDKHRHLVVSTHGTRMSTTETAKPADPQDAWNGLFLNLRVNSGGREMYMNIHITFFIAFDEIEIIEGNPVVPVLAT